MRCTFKQLREMVVSVAARTHSPIVGAPYNRIAGQSLGRLAALSDGIFGVALTLLVLDLRVPATQLIHSERDLLDALIALLPRLIPYIMTFMTVGIFWVGQQTQFHVFEHSNRDLTWIHIGFLLVVTLTPFSTALLAQYINYRSALVVYWLNIVALGLMLLWSWHYANRAGLVKASTSDDFRAAVQRRIIVAQSLYAFGALLCLINTWVSIGFIVLVQLNYVFAPKINPLYKI